MAGSIPTSDKTEYLPAIKFLCSIISALNLLLILIKLLSVNSVIIINLPFYKNFELIFFKLVIVSTVLPETLIARTKVFASAVLGR